MTPEEVRALSDAKDLAYSERNKAVVGMAWMARVMGWRVGVGQHVGEDWDDDWRTILFIDFPAGQVSWHFHDSERPLLFGLPQYPLAWDGHDTDEKWARVAKFCNAAAALTSGEARAAQHQEEER